MKPSIADRVRQAALTLGTGHKAAERLARQAEKEIGSYSVIYQKYVNKAAIESDGRKL